MKQKEYDILPDNVIRELRLLFNDITVSYSNNKTTIMIDAKEYSNAKTVIGKLKEMVQEKNSTHSPKLECYFISRLNGLSNLLSDFN